MQKTIKEANNKFEQGFNCAQAVFASYAPSLGLPGETALKIAAPFGGGIGRLGGVCGAVSGAMMVIGLKYGNTQADNAENKETNYNLARQFTERFNERHGTILCRQLLEIDISDPEILQLAHQKGVFHTRCPEYVKTAAQILAQMLEE
ncbi:C-GCAxxG-C-C family protein [Chloroflexota bacterium]